MQQKVCRKIKKKIKLKNDDVGKLLFDFVEELIYLKDAKYMLFSKFSIKIKDDKLEAVVEGEKINPEKHELKVDVKAITLHNYFLKKTKDGWKARIILDI